MTDDVSRRLELHLRSWVGVWPPPSAGLTVIGDPSRLEPTWDGSIRPLQGVGNGEATVIAVPPDAADAVRAVLSAGMEQPVAGDQLGDVLGDLLGVGPAAFGAGVFRTTAHVDPGIADLGVWFEHQTDELPEWLAPFNGPRLVAFDDDGTPIGGLGIKIHDRYGHEIAVVTEEAARGSGVARRLVATAARKILADGAAPTYLHATDNVGSARVADAVGFADNGWTVHGLWPRR